MTFRMLSGGTRPPVTTTYSVGTSSTANVTAYTFSSLALNGTGTRVVAVGATCYGGSTLRLLSSITLGGTAMTVIRNNGEDGGTVSAAAALCYLETSLTTATIVVTWAGARNACMLRVFNVYNYTSAAPASSATKVLGAVGSVASTGGSANSGVLISANRAGVASYPTYTGITGGTLAEDRVENLNTQARGNCDVTSAYNNSTSPGVGAIITATWA